MGMIIILSTMNIHFYLHLHDLHKDRNNLQYACLNVFILIMYMIGFIREFMKAMTPEAISYVITTQEFTYISSSAIAITTAESHGLQHRIKHPTVNNTILADLALDENP